MPPPLSMQRMTQSSQVAMIGIKSGGDDLLGRQPDVLAAVLNARPRPSMPTQIDVREHRVEVPPPDMNASAWAKTLKPQAPLRALCSVCGKSAASPADTQRLWTAELRPLCLGRWPSAFGLSRSGTRVFVGLPAPRLNEMSLAAGKAGDRHILRRALRGTSSSLRNP